MTNAYRIGIDVRLIDETGVGRYIKNLVEQLARIDTKNTYVLFAKKSDSQELTKKYAKLNWKIVTVDIHWHSLREQTSLGKILEREHLDLMHFPYFALPVLYRRPFIVTIHDLIIHHFPTGKASTLPLPLYHLKRQGYKQIIAHAVHHAKTIIVPLQAVRTDVIQTLRVPKDKVVVTPEGFDARIQNVSGSDRLDDIIKDKNYFLFVGNAYPHKNLEMLVDAFSQFAKKQTKPVSLVLVGKKDFFYDKLAKKLKTAPYISSPITLIHDVTDEELGALYAHAISFISASEMEGFGLPALEAMALSCPVAVSDIPAFREVCKDAAYFFNQKSQSAIVSAFDHMYTLTKPMRETVIQRGQKQTKLFSWEHMAKETKDVYERSISIR